MSQLIKAEILDLSSITGEVQIALTWETVDLPRGDWIALGEAMRAGGVPMKQRVEIRPFANRELAETAIKRLSPALVLT